ncbi:MAG: serine acetyltransferase [Muribaculaceae bacterium]|nr:serine acetyltransferase [Muribaculaceae bacterium]
MKDIAIYGAGGFGKEVACLIDRINKSQSEPRWRLIGFFDDSKLTGTPISHYGPVLGGMRELNAWPKPLNVTIAIGHPQTLKQIAVSINNPNIEFPNVIDPTFVIADEQTFRIGRGNIIQKNCFLSCDVTIGDFNVLNGDVVFGHDAVAQDYNVFMPNTRISGCVTIENENLFGACSFVIQGLKIGNLVRLSPGSMLLTKPKDGCVYMGNPAKLFKY